jgi:hypothetical protein
MTSLSDTLTIGLVLVLLFGSIALYLYTCIQQSEQKISLLESILLDLKMSNEVKSYTELPADLESVQVEPSNDVDHTYVPFDDVAETPMDASFPIEEIVEELPAPISQTMEYDSLSLKELQSLAKSKGITGITKKGALVDALKASDHTVAGTNSFLETSATVSDESA